MYILELLLFLANRRSVVHVIDAALVPWYPSIAAAVAANPLFASLAAAIASEGTLSNVVSGAVPFNGTILAPNNKWVAWTQSTEPTYRTAQPCEVRCCGCGPSAGGWKLLLWCLA